MKKDYQKPASEVVEMKMQGVLCDSNLTGTFWFVDEFGASQDVTWGRKTYGAGTGREWE